MLGTRHLSPRNGAHKARTALIARIGTGDRTTASTVAQRPPTAPIPAPRFPDSARQHGLTLIELLVVLLLVGIITSLAALSTHLAGGGARAHEEAERLRALMMLASEEAMIKTEELALNLDLDGYRFLILDEDRWTEIEDDTLRPRPLAAPLSAKLVLEGREVKLDTAEADGNDAGPRPQILFLSSGEISPFELTISGGADEEPVRLVGELTGRITLKTGQPK